MAPRRLRVSAGLVLALALSQVAAAVPPRTTVFNDIVVNEPVDGDVVAFEADVHLGPMADVSGDVVVIGGDLRLDERSRVGRHVLAVFGDVDTAPGAEVGGRVLAFRSLSNVVLRSGESEPLQVTLAVRLVTSGGWLLVTTVLAYALSTRLRFGVWALPNLGLRVLVLGVAVAVTYFAALVAALGLGPAVGVPLAATITVAMFAVRALGLTVVGGFLGETMSRRWWRRPLPLTLEVFVGVAVLLLLRFLPVVGGVVWSLCSVASFGVGVFILAATVSDPKAAAGLT